VLARLNSKDGTVCQRQQHKNLKNVEPLLDMISIVTVSSITDLVILTLSLNWAESVLLQFRTFEIKGYKVM
jgi:hypothetical protein